jgi:hypothetical protein
MTRRFEYERVPIGISFRERSAFRDTYGGADDAVFLEAHHLVPRGRPAKTLIVFMHPIGGGAYLPMVVGLARAGFHVLHCGSRYRGNDTALIMEKCVVDLGACVRHARERLGYERVVLGGWSGGGSLSLFYHPEPHPPAVRGGRASGQGAPRDRRRHPLLLRAARAARRSGAPLRALARGPWLRRRSVSRARSLPAAPAPATGTRPEPARL